MSSRNQLRTVPTEDRAWLTAALSDALAGGAPVLPVPAEPGPGATRAIARLQEQPLPPGTALVVRTSGSSGVPKAVALSAAALTAGAEATHEALGGPGQWFVTLPTHLIAGLQMLVRGAAAGIDPEFIETTGGGFDPATLLAQAERSEAERRYVSLVPVQLKRLLDLAGEDRAAADALRGFDAVLVGGQSVSLELRRQAHENGVALRRSYGMTETAGGCVYDGVPIGDTRVRIRDGEVQLTGSSLAFGYVGDPDETRTSFIEDRGARWYRTGDAGELLGGMLTVGGRLDRVIVSGGVNVSLDEVERAVAAHPGWADVVAVPVADPEWGERATLVKQIGGGGDCADGAGEAMPFEELQRAVRERLGAAAVPAWVNEMPELPRLASGKPDLQAIHAWVGMLRDSFREVNNTIGITSAGKASSTTGTTPIASGASGIDGADE